MASAISTSDGFNAKFRGCLIGALIGDCFGGPFEFLYPDPEELKIHFNKILSESDEPIEMFDYTDDTAMTLSVIKSLIENKKICPTDLAKKFVTEYFHQPARGYGSHVPHVFATIKESKYQDVFHPAKMQFNGSGSYGNGAAMRIAPVALFAHNKSEDFLKNEVEQCSFITHTHPEGYNGAILQSLAIKLALGLDSSKELDPVQFISELQDKMQMIETEENAPYCDRLEKMKKVFCEKQENILSPEEIAGRFGNDEIALESVPTAIYVFLRSLKPLPDYENANPFVRAIYFAISIGGDTDTIASMAGAISGAYFGEHEIPSILKKRCESIEEVEKLSNDLLKASQI